MCSERLQEDPSEHYKAGVARQALLGGGLRARSGSQPLLQGVEETPVGEGLGLGLGLGCRSGRRGSRPWPPINDLNGLGEQGGLALAWRGAAWLGRHLKVRCFMSPPSYEA